jgi:hypothetical protein
MALEDLLTMADITILRETLTNDGMGDSTSTVATTLLSRGVIYQAGQGASRYMSNKMVADSSHVLVCEPNAYTFTPEDKWVTHDGKTFTIQGQPDNVLEYGEIMVVGLRLQV